MSVALKVVTDNTQVKPTIMIEDNIPMPEGRTRESKYPWREMDVGQSFFVPAGKLKVMQTTCVKKGKDLGVKFIARSWDGPEGVQGVRIWRKS